MDVVVWWRGRRKKLDVEGWWRKGWKRCMLKSDGRKRGGGGC